MDLDSLAVENQYQINTCKHPDPEQESPEYCSISKLQRFERLSGGFGGFNRSLELTSLPPDNLANEFISFGMYVPSRETICTSHEID
jgi:hypothetical protein